MAGKPKGILEDKHWQALKMLEAGEARKIVAEKMGVGINYFNDLCNGNIQSAGLTADLFKKELQKIQSTRDENIKKLVKENVETCQGLIRRTLLELKSKKRLNHEEKKLLATMTNALNKSTPTVSIGNLSYSYTTGLTPEELIHEFTRLKSIAESSFDRRGVSKVGSSGSRSLPEGDESGSGLVEDEEDSAVRSTGKATSVPSS